MRKDKVGADLLTARMLPAVVAHLQVGDLVNAPDPQYDAEALAWTAEITDAPWYYDIGNHDVDGGFGGTTRTGVQAAAAFGMPGRDWIADLGFAKLISLGIEQISTDGWPVIDASSLAFLDAELASANGKMCWLTSHAPLFGTVGAGGPSTEYRSTDAGFYYQNDAAIRAIIADYPNAKAWVAGHTHSPLEAIDLVKAEQIGGHTVASINASAIEYIGNVARDPNQPLNSLYVTAVDEAAIQVRFRNHGARQWLGPDDGATRLITVEL